MDSPAEFVIDEAYEFCAPMYYDFTAPKQNEQNIDVWFDLKLEDDITPELIEEEEEEEEGYPQTPKPTAPSSSQHALTPHSPYSKVEARSPQREDDLIGRQVTALQNAIKTPTTPSSKLLSSISPSTPSRFAPVAVLCTPNQKIPAVAIIDTITLSNKLKALTTTTTLNNAVPALNLSQKTIVKKVAATKKMPAQKPTTTKTTTSMKRFASERSVIRPVRKIPASMQQKTQIVSIKSGSEIAPSNLPRYLAPTTSQLYRTSTKPKGLAASTTHETTTSSKIFRPKAFQIPAAKPVQMSTKPTQTLTNHRQNVKLAAKIPTSLHQNQHTHPNGTKNVPQQSYRSKLYEKHALSYQSKVLGQNAMIDKENISNGAATPYQAQQAVPKPHGITKATPSTLKSLRERFAKPVTVAVTPDLVKRRLRRLQLEPQLSTAERQAIEADRARKAFWQEQHKKNVNRGLAPRVMYEPKPISRPVKLGIWRP